MQVTRSFTSRARRAQIVDAAVQVIGADGFAQASFTRIAAHAGLSSTRLISYHFAGKDDLVAAVVDDVIARIGQFVGVRVGAESTASGQLDAYLTSVVAFIDHDRVRMRALMEVLLAGALPDVARAADAGHVEGILRRGQAGGEFRDFDPFVMAITIQRSVDGLPFLLAGRPDQDLDAYARELVTLFRLATRKDPGA
ncbi:TetR/AcrR family transcriptional regulator [Specibacter cremeus]|uniref:TetR/AcrR family transcriptional regulator n=1 Tax=Specibacter cremeus TaxID=1629051 RepID=UPI000F79C8BD|nr:TetR/AcrR family transcriptional regulator [Specibacter cremeus]